MKRHEIIFTDDEARTTAETMFVEFANFLEEASYGESALRAIATEVDRLLSVSNIGQYPYPLSIMNRIKIAVSDELSVLDGEYVPEDIHFMNESDSLPVMAHSYYKSVNDLILIQRNNRIYNTDEAIKKGILKVLSRDVTY